MRQKNSFGPATPKQKRARATYDALLQAAGELLAEVGVDRITTNMICARADVTPPALYRYFRDKDAVLEALGRRLMERQNDALKAWVARHEPDGIASFRGNTEELLRATHEVTRSEPGAMWILRALRASPRLAHIRLESHHYVTDLLTDAYIRAGSTLPRDELWRRLRLTVEIGFAVDELVAEDDSVRPGEVFEQTAKLMGR
ncbi:TetR/AcrR family transcriptional regulator [Erythrobacter sp. LQ02-29]|uniref:TetR/AcrR family transcriptional regulator n=1 Tax=Erythrobacter sp. LQ02-29 TaxID=2920384 RepID=UPI001F4D36E3|nr:TetR/AcrR family transcriptional regulator [Erythrobacter sp. LQ02-29]MCP9223560.1 TetR/AcrR family transcriptional regulator [Erythrobacter sp. LQ02-29]